MNLKLFLYRAKEKMKRALFLKENGFCTVLLYHRVIDLNYDPQMLCVSVKNFEDQLTLLKNKGRFLTIEEFSEIIRHKKKFPSNSFLITFDDGYADNYTNALPILEKLGLQAVFYIATKNIDSTSLFWWDELDLIFKKIREQEIDVRTLLNKHQLSSVDELYNFYVTNCKTVNSLKQRDEFVAELRTICSLSEEEKKDYSFLKRDEIKAMQNSSSAVIAAHTVNHLSLGHLSKSDQLYEITESIKVLENITGDKIEHFSFPYGEKVHYNNATLSICKDLKLKSAAANYLDIVTKNDDIYSFPRFVVRNDPAEVVFNKIKEAVK